MNLTGLRLKFLKTFAHNTKVNKYLIKVSLNRSGAVGISKRLGTTGTESGSRGLCSLKLLDKLWDFFLLLFNENRKFFSRGIKCQT